jgi:hypothetical protein
MQQVFMPTSISRTFAPKENRLAIWIRRLPIGAAMHILWGATILALRRPAWTLAP